MDARLQKSLSDELLGTGRDLGKTFGKRGLLQRERDFRRDQPYLAAKVDSLPRYEKIRTGRGGFLANGLSQPIAGDFDADSTFRGWRRCVSREVFEILSWCRRNKKLAGLVLDNQGRSESSVDNFRYLGLGRKPNHLNFRTFSRWRRASSSSPFVVSRVEGLWGSGF